MSAPRATPESVYNSDGRLLKKIATAHPEIHSIVFATEGGEECIYATVQKGTPQENRLFLKMRTDGRFLLKIAAPLRWAPNKSTKHLTVKREEDGSQAKYDPEHPVPKKEQDSARGS
jgi:hypothetical protein